MFKKLYSRESGFTLIEVLAVVVISAIIIGLISNVLLSTIKYNDKMQSHVNLRKEANLIITQVRQLYQDGAKKLCFEKLPSVNYIYYKEIYLNNKLQESSNCAEVDNSNKLAVTFTIYDKQKNEFEIKTVLEKSGKQISVPQIVIEKPIKEENLYSVLKNNNIFIYGSNLSVSGSSSLKSSDGEGTMIINNTNQSDLIFPGDNNISEKQIYINKSGNKIKFSSSTKLGETNITKIVNIKGDVILDNGGARINGESIYIDGNVDFSDKADAKIIGRKVYITGNVIFNNWWGQIIADEIYIGGKVTSKQSENIVGSRKSFVNVEIPAQPAMQIPSFREDSWYKNNNYIPNGDLKKDLKIFTDSYTSTKSSNSVIEGVVIVSKGDITITGMGGSGGLSGVLIAPNGKVTFGGNSFKGVVIAKNGFYTTTNPHLTFNNVDRYIKDDKSFPLQ